MMDVGRSRGGMCDRRDRSLDLVKATQAAHMEPGVYLQSLPGVNDFPSRQGANYNRADIGAQVETARLPR